jgi:hypothetical protein
MLNPDRADRYDVKPIFGNGRYANVTATLALVMALGGTSYAAVTITGANIKDRSVKQTDLASDSVTSAKVKNRTLLRADFKAGQLTGGAGAPGPQGAQGAQGPTGAKGEAGTPATRLFAVVPANSPTLLAQSGVASFTHNGTGTGSYTLVFDQPITNCAWLATPGSRNGGTQSTDNRIITVNGAAVTSTIEVRTAVSNAATDMTFNVAVLC